MTKNVFDQFDAAPQDANVFDQFDEKPQQEPRSAPGEILNQLRAGAVVDLPYMTGQALKYASEPGQMLYEAGKSIADSALERGRLPENAPVDESQHNAVTNALAGGARQIPQSIAPGLVAGGALALAPEALAGGTILGLASMGGAVPAAMSQGQDALEKLRESGVSEEEAKRAARINAGIEFGGETIGNYVGGKLLGVGAKAVTGGKTAEKVIENAAAPNALKPWLKATGEAAVLEPATEFGQNYGETAVENAAGAKDNPSAWDAGVSALAPTLGMTALMAPFGLIGHSANARSALQRTRSLESGDTDADERLSIANDLHQQLKDVDPQAADQFLANVLPAIENGESFTVDQNILQPPSDAVLDENNRSVEGALAGYQAVPGDQRLLGYDPSASVITVPTQDGGVTTINRNDGALSAAVVDTGVAEQLRSGSLLRSYPNQAEAQAVLDAHPEADRMQIVRHPRTADRFAVVPKSAQVLRAMDEAVQRQRQLGQEDGNAPNVAQESSQAERGVDVGSAGDSRDRAGVSGRGDSVAGASMAGRRADQSVGDILQQDAALDELAPKVAQPAIEMPGVKAANAQRAQAANQAAESRVAQVVDEEAGRANTEPSDAQVAAGNYKKGHIKVGPLDIAIENPVGSVRRGIENAKKWSTKMVAHYGYLKRTEGNDGDQVDVYVKAGTSSDFSGRVFVVDQFNPKTGQFDEHKAMVGYPSQAAAIADYDTHFSDKSGPKRRGAVVAMPIEEFKKWAKEGDTSRPASQASTASDTAEDEIAQSTGKLSRGRRRAGESNEDYLRRRADEANEAKRARQASPAISEKGDLQTTKEMLGTDNVELFSAKELAPASQSTGVLSRQAAENISQVARVFGKRVVFFSTDKNVDGFWVRGKTIYINVASTVSQLNVLGHELTHVMRREAPSAYDKMVSAVSDLLTDAEVRAQHLNYFGEELAGEITSDVREKVAEEWMADLAGNRFSESKFWTDVFQRLADRNGSTLAKSLIEKLRFALVRAINTLAKVVRGQKFQVDKRLAEHLDRVREAVTEGFADYAQAVKNGVEQQDGGAGMFSKQPGSDIGHKRTKAGDYVGAPAGMTPAKLGALRTRLRTLAKEGEPGRFWYEDSSDLILAAAGGDKALAEKIAGLLAIYSPQATVSANTSMGLKALYQWMNGGEIKVRFAHQDRKAKEWMDGTMGEKDALQIKTGNFFKNLMRKIDEDRYGFEQQGATIDMWMARVFGYGSKAIGSEARYFFAERETKRLADELGWEPQQVQAALWVSIKSRIEAISDQARDIAKEKGWVERKVVKSGGKESISWPPLAEHREDYEGLILKMALAQDPDPSGLLKASYHFGTALRERVGQISWEAMPGKTSGVLPGIFEAPLEQQVEYLAAMDKALRDENGQDLIAKKLGLPVIGTAMGPSAWQMNVGAGAQTQVAIATDRDQGNKKISVTQPARDLLNTYAAIRGYVLAQEAVVWHYPIFDASKKNANGVQLDFGHDPTHDEVVQLYRAINEVSGRDDWAPAYVPGVGVRILNFSDVPHPEFHKLIDQAVLEHTDLHLDGFRTFQSDGDYIANDWAKSPDGAEYKEIIDGNDQKLQSRRTGRSDLQGWVESELRPRAERVNQEFSEKYGWGKPSFSFGRSDAARDERVGGLAAQRSEEVRSYGQGQPGAVSVVGRHYSAEQRASLDGRYYGTGAPGREGERVRASSDPRIKERIYFYVDRGNGIVPEQGVGGHAHDVKLNNIYDGNADTWVQSKVDGALKGDAWMNAFETAILDNGFDGYVSDFGGQRAAVLLGRHSVQPTYVGVNPKEAPGQAEARVVERSKETTDADKVAKARVLPMGQQSGAEWQKLVPLVVPGVDVSMLDPTKMYYKDQVVQAMRGAKLSLGRAPVFFSPLAKAIEDGKLDNVPAGQWKNWLVANAGKLGVKKDEIQWSGINDWLDLQSGKVSKQKVLDYLNSGGVKVEEVVKDKAGQDLWIAEDDDEATYDPADEKKVTKYSGYTLPGGENYKELLLTLPGENPAREDLRKQISKIEERALDEQRDLTEYEQTLVQSYRDAISSLPRSNVKSNAFRSSHWDEPNILAHIRFNERKDVDGKSVLFIEEVQSDWGQEGKKKGFKLKRDIPTFVVEIKDAAPTYWADRDEAEAVAARAAKFNKPDDIKIVESTVSKEFGDVAPAPFVMDTKAWVSLALKRMMRYAADNGFDKVAFVNGEQSAERYDLSKQVDSVAWQKQPDGRFNIQAIRGEDEVTSSDGLSESDLADAIGKDAAEKIVSRSGVTQMGTLRGIDLKVGGEGMKTFYDKIVPQVAGDLLKKLGGKLEEVLVTEDGAVNVGAADRVGKQLGFTVPAAASEPLPLFSRGRFDPSGNQGYITELKSALAKMTSPFKAAQQQGALAKIRVMDVPSVLRSVVAMDGSKPFKKASQGIFGSGSTIAAKAMDTHHTSKHGAAIDPSIVVNLPKYLADPLAVFSGEGGSNDNSYRVVVPGATIALEPQADRVFILSIFPQDAKQIASWTRRGLLHYISEKAAQSAAFKEAVSSDQSRKATPITADESAVPTTKQSPADAMHPQLKSVAENSVANGRQVVTSRDILDRPDSALSLGRRIDEAIAKVDHAVDGLSNLPNQFDYLKDRYLALGKIARVDEIVGEIRKAFAAKDPAGKRQVYSFLTTRGAPASMIQDPELRAMAKRIKDTINYVGDQLVARGLLDQQARDHYRDQYLPRMYLRHMLDDQSFKMIGMGKKPSDLGYLKHRKDIPAEIREVILGEVKDPTFLSASAIGRAMRDVSLMDWMGKISQNNDWVFPDVFVNWGGRKVTAYWLRAEADRVERQAEHYDAAAQAKATATVSTMRTAANTALGNMRSIDHKQYKQIPDTMRYGLLRGMWVRTEIYNDIMGASQIINADPTWFEDWFGFGGKGTRLTQWWKFTKVALNPPGQVRNFLSNMVMLQLSGVGLHKLPIRLIEAARDIANNGPYWRVAKKYGVTESTFTAQELFRIKRDLLALEAQSSKLSSLRWLMLAGTKFLDGVSNLYQFSEALGKTIKIIDEMKAGKTEAQAAIEAQKWLFDYSLVPQSVRIARNAPVGMPFLTYQVKVLPRLMEVLLKHPWRLLPWIGLFYGAEAAVASAFGVGDDELRKLKRSLPEWLQDRSHTVFLPIRDKDGRVQVADIGYFFPWTFYSQAGMHLADGKFKKALVDDIGGQFSAPIVGAAAALMSNYDTFTHKPIYNESDPTSYQAAAIANYAYDLMAPPFLSSHGVVSPMGLADKKFGGKMVQAMANTTNKFGDPKATEGQAIGALVGLNFYGMDPEHTRITNLQVMNMKILEAERNLRQRMMDQGMSVEERQAVVRDYQAKMIELQQEMQKYGRESEVPAPLRVLKRQ